MKNNSISASNKTPFIIVGNTSEVFSLSPSIYTRTSLTDPTYMLIDKWQGGGFGFQSTTEIRKNNYDREVAYISESTTLLTMKGASTTYTFRIEKHDNQVTYTPLTPNARVELRSFYYDDLVSYVALVIEESNPAPPANREKIELKMHETRHQITGEETSTISVKGKKSVIIPDNTYFSFAINSNMYFFKGTHQRGEIHQMYFDTGKLTKITEKILDGLALAGGSYALTDDPKNLYPSGVSTFLIDDGFLENFAIIQFNHDLNNKSVEITVTAHNCRVCDIRMSNTGSPTIIFCI
jgi:hypothetical protein